MSFANLKRNKDKLSKLRMEAEKASSKKTDYNDDRFWKPTVDKAGNGYAVIRFLPEGKGNDLPWQRYWDHGFEGPTGKWYIEKSRTTLGPNEPDPVSEYNSELWNTGTEENKEIARKQKRRLHYVSNILVVNDPQKPECNGKVYLYEYGKKIFEKIMDVMEPKFEDEKPVNPFDFWEGANFKLKIRKVDGWTNYDKSEFENISPLSEEDSELEEIYGKLYDLNEFVDPSNFKPYAELKAKFESVLNLTSKPRTIKAEVDLDNKKESKLEKMEDSEVTFNNDNDEDEDISSYFAKFTEDDD